MENDETLHKWIAGTISEEELSEFKLRPEYPSLVELYKNTDGLAAPPFDKDAVLSDILIQPKNTIKPKNTARRIFISGWKKHAAAAVFLLLAGWFLWQYNSAETNGAHYEMAAGESTEAMLPDESIFYLNAGSELSYDDINWAHDRTIHLNGEAFFSVQKGSTFTVKTPNGDVQVLGTKFNVWSRQDIMEVKCQSGKVAVLNPDGTKIDELGPDGAIRIQLGKTVEKWEEKSVGTWREGISKFRKVPLKLVLKELELQYGVNVKTGGVNTNEIITCNFQHKNLDLALKTILSPLNINYKIIKGKTVELSK